MMSTLSNFLMDWMLTQTQANVKQKQAKNKAAMMIAMELVSQNFYNEVELSMGSSFEMNTRITLVKKSLNDCDINYFLKSTTN